MSELPPHPRCHSECPGVRAEWVVNTDGGARGNPGPGGAGILVRDPSGVVVCRGGAFLGDVTNNVAEYEALLWGLRAAIALGAREVRVRADSELIVKQMRGEYRVRSAGLKPLFLEAQSLRRQLDAATFEHVARAENAEADDLANEAMDRRVTVGDAPSPPRGRAGTLFE